MRGLAGALLLGLTFVACGLGGGNDAEALDFEVGDQVTLEDGTDVRVGSPDRQAILVQFRADGDGWTEPREVHDETDVWTHEIELEPAGAALAIDADYWKESSLTDDFDPELTVQVICHHGSCTDGVVAPTYGTTWFDDDGTAAWFHTEGGRFEFWSPEGGRRSVTLTGVAPDFRHDVEADGTLVAVTGRPVGQSCQVVLLTVTPGETEAQEVATTGYPSAAPCPLGDVSFDEHEITATPYLAEHELAPLETSDQVRFDRDGEEWSAEAPDRPLHFVPDTGGRSTLATTVLSLDDGTVLAIGSADRRTITAQVQLGDDWSEPTRVATAPAETVCRTLQQPEAGRYGSLVAPGAFVVVGCGKDGGTPPRPWRPERGLVLATSDGNDWIVQRLDHPDTRPVKIGKRAVAVATNGVFTWHPGERRLTRLALEVDGRTDRITPAPGDRLIRIRGNADPTAPCRPTWSIADLGDHGWSPEQPLPRTAAVFRTPGTCRVVQDWKSLTGDVRMRIVASDDPARAWEGGLARRGKTWRAYADDDLLE